MEHYEEDSEQPLTIENPPPVKVFGSPPKNMQKIGQQSGKFNKTKSSQNRPVSLSIPIVNDENESDGDEEQAQCLINRKRPRPITTPRGGPSFDEEEEYKPVIDIPKTAKPTYTFVIKEDAEQNQRKTSVPSAFSPVDWDNMVFDDDEEEESKEQHEAKNEENENVEKKAHKRRRKHHRHTKNEEKETEKEKEQQQDSQAEESIVDELDEIKTDNKHEEEEETGDKIAILIKKIIGTNLKMPYDERKPKYEFLQKAEELENIQAHAFVNQVNKLLDQTGLKTKANFFVSDVMEYAAEIIKKHHYVCQSDVNFRCRIVVTGPQKSGRSTTAGILASRLATELSASGHWKSSMVIPLDFLKLSPSLQMPDLLLRNIADITVSALCEARPAIIPIKDALVKSIADITTGRTKIPQALTGNRIIANDVQNIIDLLYESWNDPTALLQFYLNVLLLPVSLSKAFYITKLFVICDNYELCNVVVEDEKQFGESNSIRASEVVSILLDNSSFIITGASTENLFNVLTPLHDDSIDLTQSIYYVSTLDIVKNPSYNNATIIASTDKSKISITPDLFGGCPPFLAKWTLVNTEIDQYQEILAIASESHNPEEEDEAAEQKVEICQHLQEMLADVIIQFDQKIADFSRKISDE